MKQTTKLQTSSRAKFGRLGLTLARAAWLSQNKRNRQLQLDSLLQCLDCKSIELKFCETAADCTGCGKQYGVVDSVTRMSVMPATISD